MVYEREAYIARLAVQKASLLTQAVSEQVLAHKANNTITKEDKSPVTIGDFSAQAVIINAIKHNFPEDEVVGEEDSNDLQENLDLSSKVLKELQLNEERYTTQFGSTDSLGPAFQNLEQVSKVIDMGNSRGGNKGRIWALDPIDGTKGFLRGDQYAVCLAFIVDGVVQLGVIGCPNLPDNFEVPNYKGGLFTAIKGQGSYYSKLFDNVDEDLTKSQPIQMKNDLESTSQIRVCEGVEKGHSSHDEQSKIKEYLGIPQGQTLNLDSQVKYCSLAKGLAELYLRLPVSASYREKIWDHAAGNILITESGGVVTDMTGKELNFGEGRHLTTSGVIAGSKQFHSKVIEAIKNVIN
jgi:3'(2'), 5'-bisphosphate nucleotidase